MNSSYKTELIDRQPLFPGATELSLATAEWVAFYNRQRPNGYCQDLTPDRAVAHYHHRQRRPHTEEALRYENLAIRTVFAPARRCPCA